MKEHKAGILIAVAVVMVGLIAFIIVNVRERSEVTESVEVAAVEEILTPEPTPEPIPESTPEPILEPAQEPKPAPKDEESEEVIEVQLEDTGIEFLDQTMYAVSAVNVRAGDNADTEKVGSLSRAQEVKVTGQSKETKWYQITEEDGAIVYVSNSYLSLTKPSNQTVEPLVGETTVDVPEAPVVDYSGEFEIFSGEAAGTIGGLTSGGSGYGAGVTLY